MPALLVTLERIMTDIEQGLKEAVMAARGGMARNPLGNAASGLGSEHQRPSAATVFAMIDTIGGRVRELEEKAAELATLLAGGLNSPLPKDDGPRAVPSTLFDRFGIELLTLGHTIDRIDRDILRALETLR
jgi:hypothetical protein